MAPLTNNNIGIDFVTPGSDESVIAGAALNGNNPQSAFGAEYNAYGLKTNLVIPLTTIGKGNNAGIKTVVGYSERQTTQTPVSPSGNIQSSANVGYVTGTGWWIGFDKGIPKLFIGSATGNKMTWDGTTLTITGAINADSGTIGGFEIGSNYIRDVANSFGLSSAVTGGDDVRFWAGDTFANRATAPFRVTESGSVTASNMNITGGTLSIGSNSTIDSAGNATFISVSTLNKKAYTNFEYSNRFTNTGVGVGTAAPIYGNQGLTIAPGSSAGTYCRALWYIANVFTNNPTFTCTLVANTLNAASGDARAFIGLGQPSISGSGITYSGNSQIGFRITKTGGTVTVASETNDGGSGTSQGANITTIIDGDVLELFLKVTATNVKFYYRKNGGTITLGDTQTTHIPTGTAETSLMFAITNASTAVDCNISLQCAAYEH